MPFKSKTAEKDVGVVAHIAGPSGAGKTTLLENLKKKYPGLVAKDLDEFDEKARQQLGPEYVAKKSTYTDKMISRLHTRRQELLGSFLREKKDSPVVLAGHHIEGPHALKFQARNKLLLNTGARESALRRSKRGSKPGTDNIPKYQREAKDTIAELVAAGYKKSTPEEIESVIKVKAHTRNVDGKRIKVKAHDRKTGYHGSPLRLGSLSPRAPRGNTKFEKQKAVFFAPTFEEAALYALTRDPERKRRGWGILDSTLYLTDDKPLNPRGYVHKVTSGDFQTNKEFGHQLALSKKVRPDEVTEVTPEKFKHLVRRLKDKDELRKVFALAEKQPSKTGTPYDEKHHKQVIDYLRGKKLDARAPEEPGKAKHFDVHVDAKNPEHAREMSQSIKHKFPLKKSFKNATHLHKVQDPQGKQVGLVAISVKAHTPDQKRTKPGHVGKRAKERTTVTKAEIDKLRKALKKMKLRKGITYHYTWPGRGHAVIGDVGKKKSLHVVKTMFKPSDTPPGRRLAKLATSKAEVHALADKLNIPWDDDPGFKKWSKKVTGKTCLDMMTPEQLAKMKSALKARGMEKLSRVLTALGRKRIKEKNFALPGGRYPIHDRSHARNALARVAQHGTPAEKAKVRAAVARKYPGIGAG